MSTFLEKHKRQPKIYIDLPSKGQWYDVTIVEKAEGLAVFGMSAMDEIILKTPDALFSGEATAQVIRSCIPQILDPWKLVGYDIDYVLTAIRIATYGDGMDISTTCRHCDSTHSGTVSLTYLLEKINQNDLEYSFQMDGLNFAIQPIDYKTQTDFSVESYTLERQILDVEKQDVSREEKDKQLQTLMTQAAQLNIRVAVAHLASIDNGEEKEVDRSVILEWIKDNDATFYDKLKAGIYELTNRWELPPFEVQCENAECGKTYTTKLDMDYSNFFGARSLSSRNLIY